MKKIWPILDENVSLIYVPGVQKVLPETAPREGPHRLAAPALEGAALQHS